MTKLTTFFNRIFMLVVLLLSCTRGAFTRIFPSYEPVQKPPSNKVFALTEAAWFALRAGGDVTQQEGKSKNADSQQQRSKRGDDPNKPTKSTDEKKEPSKGRDDANAPSKSADEKKEPSKTADCDKAGSKRGDEKKKDAAKTQCNEEGPGGGDGDMGGTGG